MTELTNDTAIINRALARIGGGEIFSMDEDTDLAHCVVPVYRDLVDLLFTNWQWEWHCKTLPLDRLADEPVNGWRYGFGFPAAAIGVPLSLTVNPRVPNDLLRDFTIEQRTVYCQHEKLWGRFPTRLTPDLWPVDLRAAFTMWCAAEFCVPVAADADLGSDLRAAAVGTPQEQFRGGIIGRIAAVHASGSNTTAPSLQSDPLTDARYTGGPTSGPWYGDF